MPSVNLLKAVRTFFSPGEKVFLYGIYAITGISGVCFLYMSGCYLAPSLQLLVSWSLFGFLVIASKIEIFKRPPLRIIFLLVISFISLRYWCWRTFESIVYTGVADFIATMVLYVAEIYGIIVYFLGVFVNIWPLNRKIVPLPADISLYPTVDIFIPTYNEPEDIVKTTVIAATQLDYPKDKLCIYILDDGGTVAKRNDPAKSSAAWERYYCLKRLARELGVVYMTREHNKHAKAGNLNHALQHSKNDLVLVLDCDHVPTRDILKNTVGNFLKDKKLFLVQTPHFFINPDPFEKNLGIFETAPGEAEMFYHSVHPGLDLWNSSYFCGSAAVLRRKHLEEVGGIAGDTITEDAETTLSLHCRGYNSVYINRPMVCGLSPEVFDDLILQRSRWTQGMIQIFILKNPLFSRGLKLCQRFCYLSSGIFWFFSFARFLFYIVPAAFLLFGLQIYHASASQVIAYAAPHVLGCILVSDFLHGKYRWPFFSEIYESAQSIFLIPVIFSVLFNPKAPTFKVTPKGKNLEETALTPRIKPFILMVIMLVACLPMAAYKWFYYPLYRDVIIITLCWCSFNLFVAMASLGAFLEKKQIRGQHRMWSKGKVNVFFPRMNSLVQGEIKDVSFSGMGLEIKVPFSIKQEEDVTLSVRDIYGNKYTFEARVCRQIKRGGNVFCGCVFVADKIVLSQLVRFVYGDSQRWSDFLEKRSRRVNIVKILFFIASLGYKGSRDCLISTLYVGYKAIKTRMYPVITICKRIWLRTEIGWGIK